MGKKFRIQGNAQYLDRLPKLVKVYNNTKHSSIMMTAMAASIRNYEGLGYFNLWSDMERSKHKTSIQNMLG